MVAHEAASFRASDGMCVCVCVGSPPDPPPTPPNRAQPRPTPQDLGLTLIGFTYEGGTLNLSRRSVGEAWRAVRGGWWWVKAFRW